MNFSRRQALLTTLFGGGCIGLRAVATGLPISFLLNPRKALADMGDGAMPMPGPAQFVIFNTSASGDPINCNCPGSYGVNDGILHPDVPGFAASGANAAPMLSLGGQPYQAAAPWAALLSDSSVADRTLFFHMATNQLIHPNEPQVLELNGAAGNEMLPSLIAKSTAPALKTIQPQPVCVGASGPAEAIDFDGAPLPIIPPSALQDTLLNPTVSTKGVVQPSPLSDLQGLRDKTMNKVYGIYKNVATPQQQQYLDQLITTQTQVRQLNQTLLNQLATLPTDPVAAQIVTAVTLIQLNVSPVITIHIPFGGDNHGDPLFATEVAQTITGVGATEADGGSGAPTTGLAFMLDLLKSNNLQDQVSFMSLNVFGRTLNGNGGVTNGRGHNSGHHVGVCIGKPFKGGVVGGINPTPNHYGFFAQDIGSVVYTDTLAAFAMTMLQAVGAPTATVQSVQSTTGKVVAAALQ